jgi:DNA-binding response OmpR family regulator
MAIKKILIADDEQDVLEILAKKLAHKGYEVRAVGLGKAVIDTAKTFHPDLLIQDILMTDFDGYTIAQSLRSDKTLPSFPIIFMTGKDLQYDGIAKKVAGFDRCDFVLKPCTFEELLRKIEEVAAR